MPGFSDSPYRDILSRENVWQPNQPNSEETALIVTPPPPSPHHPKGTVITKAPMYKEVTERELSPSPTDKHVEKHNLG